jgi:hypothetical protein
MTDGQIEEPPEDVHCWGGQALSGRVGERRGEGIARDAMYEMRYRIRQKDSREETGEVVIPVQMVLPWIGCHSSLSACLFRWRVRKRGAGMIEEQRGERVMEQYLPPNSIEIDGFS